MSKIDKGFILGFIGFMENTYRNTKSPDNPREMSPHTLFLYQSTLIRMLNAAVKEGVLDRNPFYSLERKDRISKQQAEKEYLTKEELKALAEAPNVNETTKRAFLFCYFTGLRYSDVSALAWRDIKQSDNGWIVSVKSMQKTGKPVIVPLNQSAMGLLPDKNECKPSQKVFAMTCLSACDRCLKKMAAAAKIEKNISFHTSRHTFAVLALAASGDIYTVGKLMGHTSINSTQVYADVLLETKMDAINRISTFFSL